MLSPRLLALDLEYEKNPFEGTSADHQEKSESIENPPCLCPAVGFNGLPHEDISGKITPTFLRTCLAPIESNKNLVMATLVVVGGVAYAMGPMVEKSSKEEAKLVGLLRNERLANLIGCCCEGNESGRKSRSENPTMVFINNSTGRIGGISTIQRSTGLAPKNDSSFSMIASSSSLTFSVRVCHRYPDFGQSLNLKYVKLGYHYLINHAIYLATIPVLVLVFSAEVGSISREGLWTKIWEDTTRYDLATLLALFGL
ncbi:hypothetical protein IFM89_016759 [Coptis chinensis]|uniref:Uncharacterized protein n=1 Tax=Coptis chinensis TaxID=261450 RepID=A0A835H6J6_9MAGN|nr:hypothetical protein IFM89_016759 [Coptis chinensis]